MALFCNTLYDRLFNSSLGLFEFIANNSFTNDCIGSLAGENNLQIGSISSVPACRIWECSRQDVTRHIDYGFQSAGLNTRIRLADRLNVIRAS